MLVIFALCLVLTIVAVTDLSAAYLRRQTALSLADGAALAATEAAAASSVYDHPNSGFVDIDQPAAAKAVRLYLGRVGAFRSFRGLTVRVAVVGHRVVVAVVMPYRLPVPVPGVAPTTLIHATSAAELPVYS
jgi:hypothetical protein